ncbi:MAG: hypothetical protein MJ087_04630 [Lachnospiraceae bacterium]|nr:hypothetical protein [Lachnospiraceae bacterium]
MMKEYESRVTDEKSVAWLLLYIYDKQYITVDNSSILLYTVYITRMKTFRIVEAKKN